MEVGLFMTNLGLTANGGGALYDKLGSNRRLRCTLDNRESSTVDWALLTECFKAVKQVAKCIKK